MIDVLALATSAAALAVAGWALYRTRRRKPTGRLYRNRPQEALRPGASTPDPDDDDDARIAWLKAKRAADREALRVAGEVIRRERERT